MNNTEKFIMVLIVIVVVIFAAGWLAGRMYGQAEEENKQNQRKDSENEKHQS